MKVVWHCEDRAGSAMAGPALRAAALAARLSRSHEVTLVCPGASGIPESRRRSSGPPFAIAEHLPGASLLSRLRDADVFVAQGFGFAASDLWRLPERLRFVLDLYDPVQLELLARLREEPTAERHLHLALVRRRLLRLLFRADHVLCASERQRALWLGWLGAAGRLTPETLRDDAEALRLLSVVPFGIEEAPAPAAPAVLPVRDGDLPVLFWGGLWDWMDAITAIRAVGRLRASGIRATLVLPGNRQGGPPMSAAARAVEEARAQGLWGDAVVQLPSWAPADERIGILRAAVLAVSTHRSSLEAELSFRTRLLDCVWASLPVAATAGDELSARGEREGWVRTAAAGDTDALAAAIASLLDPQVRQRAQAAARAAAPGYSWDRAAATLLALLDGPSPPRPRGAIRLAPELSGADPSALARAAARKLGARALRLLGRGR